MFKTIPKMYHAYFYLEITWQHNRTSAVFFNIPALCRPLTPICGNYQDYQVNTNSPCLYSCYKTVCMRITWKLRQRTQTQSTSNFKVLFQGNHFFTLLINSLVQLLKHTSDRLRCQRLTKAVAEARLHCSVSANVYRCSKDSQ